MTPAKAELGRPAGDAVRQRGAAMLESSVNTHLLHFRPTRSRRRRRWRSKLANAACIFLAERMLPDIATALVGAAMLSVLFFPTFAGRLLNLAAIRRFAQLPPATFDDRPSNQS
jgi:hypothetical protein